MFKATRVIKIKLEYSENQIRKIAKSLEGY